MLSYVISVTLLTLAVILVRAIFRNKMSSRLVYALWLAVLLRMVLPFDVISIDRVGVDYLGKIESAAGYEIVLSEGGKTEEKLPQTEGKPIVNTPVIENIASGNKEPVFNSGSVGEQTGEVQLGNTQTGEAYIPEISTDKSEIGEVVPSESGVTGSIHSEKEPLEIESTGKPSTVIPSVPQVDAEKPSVDLNEEISDSSQLTVTDDVTEKISVSVKDVLNTVWFAGAVITPSVFAVSWAVFSVKLVRSRTLLTRSGKTCVYVSDRISSPCVCGIIPKIYVTPEARDSENLSTVILHERIHASHGDVIWNVLRIAAVSVFWYNPVIWAAAILSKRDAEFACDETTALKLEDKSKLEYALMIVDMTPAKKNYAVSFAGGPIKERVLKLTGKYKNKVIVAVIAVLLVAVCIVVAFIGISHISDKSDETDSTKTTQSEEATDPDENKDTENTAKDPEPEPLKWEVYEATDENVAKYSPKKQYDVSTWEYNFSLIIVPSHDVTDFKINRLMWDEELLVEGEEVLEDVGEVKAGEAMLITTDSVEIIGYVGISYTYEGKTERYYPATSGMDGSALLVEIGGNLLSPAMLYPGLEVFQVTVSEDVKLKDALYSLQKDVDGNYTDFFYNDNAKVVKVNGLWVPFYIEFGDNWNIKSISAYGHIVEREISSDPPCYFLTEWAETIVFNYSTNSKDDSWVFTRERVNEFVTEDGVSTLISANEDGELEYLRYSVKFYGAAKKTKTFPLDYALSRDEFFKETGKAKLKNGKIILEKTESFTIGEAFDIDAIYEEYKLNYLGYDSADDVIERNIRREEGKESPIKETAVMPTEYHKGIWTDGYDDIIISKVTDDTITFQAGIFRMFGFNGIATLKDGVWEFIEDNSYVTDEDKIKGRLEFTQTSVKVIYDTCGRFSDYVKDGYTCYFTRHTSGGSTIDRLQPCGGKYYAPYNNEYLGLYKMSISSSTQYDFDYRVSVSVCNGSCKCDGWNYNQYDRDEIKAVAQYGVTDGWPYPVKIYYSTPDEKFKETDMQHYMELMRSATYVFDIGDGVHFDLFIQRYDYISPLEDNELEILNSIAKNCFIELNFINGKTGDAISVDLGDAIGTPTDDIINAKFNVYSVEDYGEDRVKGLPVYDKSSSENCFKFVLEAKEDDLSAYLTYLNWHDNKYVEKELQTTLISTLMKGEACVICVDVYEPVSRVGIQFQHNGKFYRACPVLDEYGKPMLESIDDLLGPTMHLNGEIYPVTVGGADTLQSQLDKLFENVEFAERNSKMLEVNGLSKEFYFSLSYDDLRGAWLDNKSYKLVSDCDEEDLGNLKTEIFEWNGYIVLSRKSYEVGDTWFFKDGDVVEYHPNGVNSVTFSLDENGNLKYTRFYRKFNGKVHENATSVLEIAIERNDSLRETGSVTVNENGKLILNAEKKYTVSDVYDLDALFKEYSKTDEFKHKYPTCTTVDEVINYNLKRTVLKNHGVTDSRYKWLSAFLDGDAETLVDITVLDSTTNGMIDGVPAKELMVTMLKEFFSEITIGEFKIVSMKDSKSLQFDFELLSSNTKYFPAGEYSVILRDGSMFTNPGVYFELRPGVVEIADEDEAFFAEQMFISWYGDAEYPNADSSYASLVLFYLYEETFGLDLKGLTELTRAELEAIASEVYEDGFEINYWPFDYHEGENGEVGYYTVRGMGGTVEYHDVVSRVEKNGVITYDVVYYAEPTTLIPAKTVRYTVERTNSVYGFKLTGVEEIDNTGFDIFTQGM